jgi:hypothetical protein
MPSLPRLRRTSTTRVFARQSGTFFTTVRRTVLVSTVVERTMVVMTAVKMTAVKMTAVKNVPDWKVWESDVKVVDVK